MRTIEIDPSYDNVENFTSYESLCDGREARDAKFGRGVVRGFLDILRCARPMGSSESDVFEFLPVCDDTTRLIRVERSIMTKPGCEFLKVSSLENLSGANERLKRSFECGLWSDGEVTIELIVDGDAADGMLDIDEAPLADDQLLRPEQKEWNTSIYDAHAATSSELYELIGVMLSTEEYLCSRYRNDII